MDQLWYYAREGQSLGPVSFAELKRLAANGQLDPADSVCPAGAQEWQPARTVPNLFTESPAPQPLDIDDSDDRPRSRDRDRGRDRDRDRDRYDDDRDRDRDRDRYDDRYRGPGNDPLEGVKRVLRRTFTLRLNEIEVTEDESRQLKRAGLTEAVAQRFASGAEAFSYLS